jgi:hypothetical protein
VPARTIFRESAIEAYRRRTERDIVPRVVPGPVIACFWLLLVTLMGAVLLAWSLRVPTYAGASGVVVREDAAVLFLPADDAAALRTGRTVRGQIGSSGRSVEGSVAKVDARLIGPDTAQRRYRPQGGAALITQPSSVLIVRLADALPAETYAGSRLTARVQTGSQRLLGLLPGVGKLLGGGS